VLVSCQGLFGIGGLMLRIVQDLAWDLAFTASRNALFEWLFVVRGG